MVTYLVEIPGSLKAHEALECKWQLSEFMLVNALFFLLGHFIHKIAL